MALIKCPECGRENVSDTAEACPDCGYGIKLHFENIEKERIAEQKKIEAERLKKEKEQEIKEREKQRIESIKPPEKPKISIAGLIVGILMLVFGISQINTDEYDRNYSMNHGNGDPVIYGWLFTIIAIAVLIFIIAVYFSNLSRYNFAQDDFESYKKQVIKEQDKRREIEKEEYQRRLVEYKNAIKCPICGSRDVTKISTVSRAISVGTVGLASSKIGKQYKCNACKHMW